MKRELLGNRVKVRLGMHVRSSFAPPRRDPPHEDSKQRMSSEEALVVVTSKVWARLIKPLEAPSAQLSGEGSELGLTKEFGDHLVHKELLIEHFPGTAVRHPCNDVRILLIGQYRMQTSRKVPIRLLVFLYPPSVLDVGGKVMIGVVGIAREGVFSFRCCFLRCGGGVKEG